MFQWYVDTPGLSVENRRTAGLLLAMSSLCGVVLWVSVNTRTFSQAHVKKIPSVHRTVVKMTLPRVAVAPQAVALPSKPQTPSRVVTKHAMRTPRKAVELEKTDQTPVASAEAAPVSAGEGASGLIPVGGEAVAGNTAPAEKPVQLPENATPPEAFADNAMPSYPEEARHLGLGGQVVLKIVVSHNGTVEDVLVMKGEEPFVAAALAAVKTWRYKPALIEGVPSSVYRIVKIPFRLRE